MGKSKKRNDLILTVAILIVAVLVFAITSLTAEKGDCVVVTIDGNEVGKYYLSEDIEKEFKTDDEKVNTLVIKDGKAYVSYASCPDKICVEHRKISKEGESIVCLPHKFIVSVEKE